MSTERSIPPLTTVTDPRDPLAAACFGIEAAGMELWGAQLVTEEDEALAKRGRLHEHPNRYELRAAMGVDMRGRIATVKRYRQDWTVEGEVVARANVPILATQPQADIPMALCRTVGYFRSVRATLS